MKLFLKGNKCYTKCILDSGKRKGIPGQHGTGAKGRRVKVSEYAKRLREKQRAKRLIGITEREFRRYFDLAERQKGLTGETLLKLLELRLDNVLHRMGFALSRPQARQLVSHGHVSVNGRSVNVPSYALKPGDKIQLQDSVKGNVLVQQAIDTNQKRGNFPSWFEVSAEGLNGTIRTWPARDEISIPVNEQLIVELYSK